MITQKDRTNARRRIEKEINILLNKVWSNFLSLKELLKMNQETLKEDYTITQNFTEHYKIPQNSTA